MGRRARRFFMGAEIPDGVLAYKSRHQPVPLSELVCAGALQKPGERPKRPHAPRPQQWGEQGLGPGLSGDDRPERRSLKTALEVHRAW
jgi:hypothetical protein